MKIVRYSLRKKPFKITLTKYDDGTFEFKIKFLIDSREYTESFEFGLDEVSDIKLGIENAKNGIKSDFCDPSTDIIFEFLINDFSEDICVCLEFPFYDSTGKDAGFFIKVSFYDDDLDGLTRFLERALKL